MTVEQKETDTKVTVRYNCTGCNIFHGGTTIPVQRQQEVTEQIRTVWLGHQQSMHPGKGELIFRCGN